MFPFYTHNTRVPPSNSFT